MLSVAALTPAQADDWLVVGGCLGWRGSVNCAFQKGPPGDPYVRLVPAPAGDEAKAQAKERDHLWLDRCRPVITQDAYGVPRYRYTAPGCEFGVVQ